jgi:putative tryptophan/tyrosine transport system substrate-binding protein
MSRLCGIVIVLFIVAPVFTEAQQAGRVARVGELVADPLLRQTFRQGLRELGWFEGQNITFETRGVEGPLGRLSDLAAELVRLRVDLILVDTSPALQAVRQATKAIPIVMTGFGDPVAEGFVTALARPGGNITGFSWQTSESAGKRLELLKEALSTLSRVAVLFDPQDPVATVELRAIQAAARELNVATEAFAVGEQVDRELLLAIKKARADALIVVYTARTAREHMRIVEFTTANRLPLMSEGREFTEAGGLMTYGPKMIDLYRRAAVYADKILKGAKPADLPIEQPMKFELVINLQTAKALGLTISQPLRFRADQLLP